VLDSVLICLSKWSQVDVSFASFFFCFCSSSEVGDGHATQGRGMGSPGPSGLTETPGKTAMNATVCFYPRMGDGFPRAQLSNSGPQCHATTTAGAAESRGSAGRSARSENERYEKGNKERSSTRSATRTSAERELFVMLLFLVLE
jgi:hypothetical protein